MNNNEALNDLPKRGRGRPKGSKNKPKNGSTTEKKAPLKVPKKVNKKQLDTYFIIKPRTGGKCYYQCEITVDYTPHKEHEFQDKVSIVPRLNTDNKPHIPGFIMDMDRQYYEKHDQRYKEDHEAKIQDYTKPKSRLYLPKPGKRHNYCCVCKQSYEDYLEHVSSTNHKKSYNNNEFSQNIKSISKEYEHNHRNNLKMQESADLQTDTLTQEEDECLVLQLTDSSTQKYGTKISNEKPNKGSPNQYISNNVYQQGIKKTQSQINNNEIKQNPYLQKSVSLISKSGNAIENVSTYDRLLYNQNHSTQATLIGLNTKQTSNPNFQHQMYLNPYLNVPTAYAINSNEDNLMMQHDIIPNISNNNSHNNSLNNLNNNNNTIASQSKKSSYMPQRVIQANNGINCSITSTNNTILNLKRKADTYPEYNETLETTRKQYQIQKIAPKQIIDLTDEGNDSQKPSVPLIAQQNTAQARMSSNNNQFLQFPNHYVVCND